MDDVKNNCSKIIKKIANKILMIRRAHNLTQEEFAEQINIEPRTLSRAESGKHNPAIETLEKICIAFNIPISYFYDNSIYEINSEKTEVIKQIDSKLNVFSKEKLDKINKIIDII